jgi:hypothetical protein
MQFAASPQMAEYHRQRRQRELKAKGRSSKLPLLALGAIGAGVGAHRFGDWVISASDLGKINELMAFQAMTDKQTGRANSAWKGTTDFYTQYLDRAGRAAQVKGFGGHSAGDLMVGYRKHIEPRIGGKYPVTSKSDEDAAYEHYNTFASGPMQAFVHHIKSYTGGRPEAERAELMSRLMKGFSTSASGYLGIPQDEIAKTVGNLETPLDPQRYSFGKQLDVVRNYLASFSGKSENADTQWERSHLAPLLDTMRDGVANAAKGYGGLSLPLNLLHKVPKAVGVGLAGAGAAALTGWGGYKLYERLTRRNREAEAKKEDLRQRRALVHGFFEPSKAASLNKSSAMTLPHHLRKQAFQEADIERLLPEDSSRVSDFFLMPGAQRRAGRARGLAEAFGNEADLGVQYPKTQRVILGALGAGLGAAVGGALGGSSPADASPKDRLGRELGGTSAGAFVGGAAGILLDTVLRRRAIRDTKGDALRDMREGEQATPAIGRGSRLAALVSGVHQQGRADTAEAIAHGRRSFEGNPAMTALTAAGLIPGLDLLTAIPKAVGSAANYGEARRRIAAARPVPTRQVA